MARQLREPTERLHFARPMSSDNTDVLLAEVRRLRMVCDRLAAALDDLTTALADSADSDVQAAARRAQRMLVGLQSDAVVR